MTVSQIRVVALGVLALLLLSLGPLAEPLRAQEIEPRAYANAPVGMNAVVLAYSLSSGDIVTDATAPIQDFETTAHTAALFYVRTFGAFGKLVRAQIMVPATYLSGSAKLAGQDTTGTRSGFGDARVRLGINLFGSPALKPKDFRLYSQETILGVSTVIAVPIGEYNPAWVVNLGSNRWGFKAEVGASHRFKRWYVEAYGGGWFFTDNTNYLGQYTLKQDPIYSVQAHITYIFPSRVWVAVDGLYVDGGETYVDGQASNSFQKNWRLGATFSMPLWRGHSVKLLFHSGVATRAGGDFDIVSLAYQYTWF